MGKLSPEERPVMGQMANAVRAEIEAKLEERKAAIHTAVLEAKLAAEAIDVTIPDTTETTVPAVAAPAVETTPAAPASAEPTLTPTQEQPIPNTVAAPAVNTPAAEALPVVQPVSSATEEASSAL